MDQTWCAPCFTCTTCDKRFSAETGYHEHESRPFCEPCYADVALPKCKACGSAIKDRAVKALNADWHLGCFVCKVCILKNIWRAKEYVGYTVGMLALKKGRVRKRAKATRHFWRNGKA